MNYQKKSQEGAIGAVGILLVVVVVAVVGYAGWRVVSSDDDSTKANINTTQETDVAGSLPTNLEGFKTLEEITELAGSGVAGVDIIDFVLEEKDGEFIYKVIFSDGRKVRLNASSGEILSEETTDVSDDDKIPAGLTLTVTPAQAYAMASTYSDSAVVKIEFEVEDDKITYKVEFKDGSKVEIDASSGTVVKSNIKGGEEFESEDEHEDDGHEHEEDDDDDEEDDHDEDEDKHDDEDDDHEDDDEDSSDDS